jgi:uncharacterized phage protein (predicted DNA packaging)
MATVTLAQAKKHIRVTHNLEDDMIELYIEAADDWIANYLNTANFPNVAAIKAAALIIIEDLYRNRGTTMDQTIQHNPAVDRLLYPYREEIGI